MPPDADPPLERIGQANNPRVVHSPTRPQRQRPANQCEPRPPHTRPPLTSIFFHDLKKTTAMLDRLLHRATVVQINGPSYRLRAHQAAAASLRDDLGAPETRQ